MSTALLGTDAFQEANIVGVPFWALFSDVDAQDFARSQQHSTSGSLAALPQASRGRHKDAQVGEEYRGIPEDLEPVRGYTPRHRGHPAHSRSCQVHYRN